MTKVKLTKFTRCNGNAYHVGTYDREYLPEQILNTAGLVIDLGSPESITPNYKNALQKESISIGEVKETQKKTSFKPPETVDLDNKDSEKKAKKELKDESKSSVFDLNSATVDELASIDGITVNTAQSVVEKRSDEKFADYEDLDKRVALKGGRKWDSFKDRLEIK